MTNDNIKTNWSKRKDVVDALYRLSSDRPSNQQILFNPVCNEQARRAIIGYRFARNNPIKLEGTRPSTLGTQGFANFTAVNFVSRNLKCHALLRLLHQSMYANFLVPPFTTLENQPKVFELPSLLHYIAAHLLHALSWVYDATIRVSAISFSCPSWIPPLGDWSSRLAAKNPILSRSSPHFWMIDVWKWRV